MDRRTSRRPSWTARWFTRRGGGVEPRGRGGRGERVTPARSDRGACSVRRCRQVRLGPCRQQSVALQGLRSEPDRGHLMAVDRAPAIRRSWRSRPTLDGTQKLLCCRQHVFVVAAWFAAVSTSTVVSHDETYASTPSTTAAAMPTPQLPGGGSTLFPGRLLVAIYGHTRRRQSRRSRRTTRRRRRSTGTRRRRPIHRDQLSIRDSDVRDHRNGRLVGGRCRRRLLVGKLARPHPAMGRCGGRGRVVRRP